MEVDGKYLLTIRSGRASRRPRGSRTGPRRANFVSGKAREGGDVPSPLGPPGGTRLADPDPPTPAEPGEGRYPDRAQRRRGRKAPARPATQDRGGVSRPPLRVAGLCLLAA